MLALVTVLQRAIGLGRSLVVCRWLSGEELGRWDLAFGFLMAAGPLVVLGLPSAFGRFAEAYRGSGQLHRFIGTTVTVCGLSLAVTSGSLVLLRGQVSRLLFDSESNTNFVAALVLVLVSVVAFNYLTSLAQALRFPPHLCPRASSLTV